MSLKVVETELDCWQRGQPLPRSVGGLSPEEPCRWEKEISLRSIGLRGVGGGYLVPNKILAGKKHQRKRGKEKQKLPKLARLASLASPHCSRGKEQGWSAVLHTCQAEPGKEVGMVSSTRASLLLRPWDCAEIILWRL